MTEQKKTLPGVITKSRWLPPRTMIYGSPGIGKSTFGCSAVEPVFIPTEAGVENMDVARFPVAATLADFLASLKSVASGDHDYKTVVIDTVNGLMDLYYNDRKSTADFRNYGGFAGWREVAQSIKTDVLTLLDQCQRRGMYVILLAHTGTFKRKNPLGDDVETAGPSIPKWVWEVVQGWLDVIGRAEYVFVTTGGKKGARAKAETVEEIENGVRVKQRRLYFAGGIEQDAKARVGYELPGDMPFSWEDFARALGDINALIADILSMRQYIAQDKTAATLQWLGVPGWDQLKQASRQKLSMLRNRLIEARDKSLAEQE